MSSVYSLFVAYICSVRSVAAGRPSGAAHTIGRFATRTLLLTPPVVEAALVVFRARGPISVTLSLGSLGRRFQSWTVSSSRSGPHLRSQAAKRAEGSPKGGTHARPLASGAPNSERQAPRSPADLPPISR